MEISANRIGTAAQKLKDGAVEMGSKFMDKSGEYKDAALEKGREFKDAAMVKGRAAYDKSAKTIHELQEQGEAKIKANPYSSVMYAFGIGALIGGVSVLLATMNTKRRD